jgi:hypothetical protein
MINAIALLFTLNCPDPKLVNTSGQPWNDFDLITLNRATRRCPVKYPESPCVISFKRYSKYQDYSVVCGKELNQKN